jgi:iron complex transport system substrate-binding protein
VGRSMHCNWPAEVDALPSVGSGLDPDLERLVALEPTIVVASSMQRALPILERLGALGVEVVVLPDERLIDIAPAFRQLGAATGRELDAERVAASFDALLDGWNADATPDDDAPYVFLAVGHEPVYAAGPGSRLGEAITLVRARNVLERGDWVLVDAETLATLRPDIVVASDAIVHPDYWGGLAPHPDRRYCGIDADLMARPGPRMIAAVDALRACIHGDEP